MNGQTEKIWNYYLIRGADRERLKSRKTVRILAEAFNIAAGKVETFSGKCRLKPLGLQVDIKAQREQMRSHL